MTKLKSPPRIYDIKFTPQTEEELNILNKDSTLILYDYPLDHEIEASGYFYRDPKTPVDQPNPQYCAVKVDYVFPTGVRYEVLEELFIPDEEKDDPTGRVSSSESELVQALVEEALRITNNVEQHDKKNHANARTDIPRNISRSRWRPKGTITVWDDNIGNTNTSRREFVEFEYYNCQTGDRNGPRRLEMRCRTSVYRIVTTSESGSYVGLAGAKVRARWWFITHTGIVNPDGTYSCDGRFYGSANYSIKWRDTTSKFETTDYLGVGQS